MGDLNYTKIKDKIKELNKKRILKNIIKTIVITFFVLYFIAFVMKDRANNEFSRTLCREFVNAPRNIASLIVNKFRNDTMNYKTNIITKSERKQSTQEKDILVNEKNNLLQEKEALSNDKNNLLQEKEALSNDKNNLLQEIQALKNQINAQNPNTPEKSPEQIISEQENAEKNKLIGYSNLIKQQKEVDEMLLSELNSGDYTFDDPLVVLDPYGVAPLCAVVIFKTNDDVKISVEMDKDEEETKHDFYGKTGYKKEHIIPIYGLYPDFNNKITLISTDKTGKRSEKVIQIKTDKLPKDLEDMQLITYLKDKEKYNKGFNYTYAGINHAHNRKCAFDRNGNIRYYLLSDKLVYIGFATNYTNLDSIWSTNGRIVFKIDPLGKILALYHLDNERLGTGVHHDIEVLSKSILLTTEGYMIGSWESGVTEVDIDTGKEINHIEYMSLFPRTRKLGYYSNEDWIHMNAIVEDKDDYIISSNVQSSIMKNSRSGEIKWILSDPIGWHTKWKEKLLKPIGKGFEYSYNQHAVEILPDYDNNPDTIDIILFDNGQSRNIANKERSLENGTEFKEIKLYSRLVHYRINEKKMTVEQIWQYGKERLDLYSPWRGDADLLPNGNLFGTFNQTYDSPERELPDRGNTVYVEVNRNGEVIWECYAASKLQNNFYQDYRCERLMPYNNEAENLYIGVPCNNLISEDLYKKYGLTKE